MSEIKILGFTIIPTDDLTCERNRLVWHIDKSERMQDKAVKLEQALIAKDREERNLNMSETPKFTNFTLTRGRFFEIVKVSTGQFLACDGFDNEEDALIKARELAVLFPTETFMIYAPIRTVKAEIPVIDEAIVHKPLDGG